MSLEISAEILSKTTDKSLAKHRKYCGDRYERSADYAYALDIARLSSDALADISVVAKKYKDGKTGRAVDALLAARGGKLNQIVPSFAAFKGLLITFLKRDVADGWIYVEKNDGKIYPELVTQVVQDKPMHGEPFVRIHTAFYGFGNDGYRMNSGCYSFQPGDVVRRSVADILGAEGIFKETPELRKTYNDELKHHDEVVRGGFSKQYRFTGKTLKIEDEYKNRGGVRPEALNRQVIHDLPAGEMGAVSTHAESILFEDEIDDDDDENDGKDGTGSVPRHPVTKIFDLRMHEFYWVNSTFLKPHVYDKSLREKLILPQSHRDLLDVLTSDLDAFTRDIIDGKSAGNVVLGMGIAGVGKTLTAEVYAELTEKPLYSVHSGTLGTDAESIDKSLRVVFNRSKRWGCVLLIDEADVFVMQRGTNIQQNAIVAEFLRTLEYFDGLLFMTTNRPNDIDEAIISRCAAIIRYNPPDATGTAAVWRVMATQFETKLDEHLIAQLINLFPDIAPRDIKMLLRLVLRVARKAGQPPVLETFRRCAMFRAININQGAL